MTRSSSYSYGHFLNCFFVSFCGFSAQLVAVAAWFRHNLKEADWLCWSDGIR